MSLEETALTQTRQLMASQLPEYRPFALQEIVRAATFQGGDVKSLQKSSVRVHTSNPLNVPAWLDILLYCVTAFVIGTAIFMGMYASLVRPYQIDIDDETNDITIRQFARQSVNTDYMFTSNEYAKTHEKKGEMKVPGRGSLATPPHPPPPMLPAGSTAPNALPLPTL